MRIARNESGQAAAFVVIFLGVLACALLALAVDFGYLFHQKRLAQAAADAAALAALEEVVSGNSIGSSAVVNAANVAATANGFNTGATTNPATVTLTSLASGNYPSSATTPPTSWVQAYVSQPVKTIFLGGFPAHLTTMTVGASAIAAGGVPSSTCICITGTSGNDLNMSNNGALNAINCGITANSNASNAITIVGSASVCGTNVKAVSTNWDNTNNINNSGSICPAAQAVQGASACAAPNIVTPALPNGLACNANPVAGYILGPNAWNSGGNNGDYTLPMNGATQMSNGRAVALPNDIVSNNNVCYTSLDMSGASSIHFTAGYTYFIQGAWVFGGGEKVYGTNVQFVMTTSSSVNIANGVTVNLTAPNAADGNPGVLFYAPNASAITLAGGANSNFAGILFAPNSPLTVNNGTNTTTKMDLVVNTLTMAGGATLTDYATSLINGGGSGGIGVPVLVQ